MRRKAAPVGFIGDVSAMEEELPAMRLDVYRSVVSVFIYMYLHIIDIYIMIHMYTYIERKRERERG